MKILAVYGSTGNESQSLKMIQQIAAAAQSQGAEIEYLDLLSKPLPMFRADLNYDQDSAVQSIRQAVGQAQGFMVVSPEYHGCMSSWIKNFFDFHYHEFAGKLFALASSTGGSMGVSCNTQMRIAVQHCHGWALPYQTASRKSDYNEAGELISPSVIERLQRMGRDLVVYGRLLGMQFEQDRRQAAEQPESRTQTGFAGWYA